MPLAWKYFVWFESRKAKRFESAHVPCAHRFLTIERCRFAKSYFNCHLKTYLWRFIALSLNIKCRCRRQELLRVVGSTPTPA